MAELIFHCNDSSFLNNLLYTLLSSTKGASPGSCTPQVGKLDTAFSLPRSQTEGTQEDSLSSHAFDYRLLPKEIICKFSSI